MKKKAFCICGVHHLPVLCMCFIYIDCTLWFWSIVSKSMFRSTNVCTNHSYIWYNPFRSQCHDRSKKTLSPIELQHHRLSCSEKNIDRVEKIKNMHHTESSCAQYIKRISLYIWIKISTPCMFSNQNWDVVNWCEVKLFIGKKVEMIKRKKGLCCLITFLLFQMIQQVLLSTEYFLDLL